MSLVERLRQKATSGIFAAELLEAAHRIEELEYGVRASRLAPWEVAEILGSEESE